MYKYFALISVTLGGTEFLPGKELPSYRDYQDLYDAGMVSRKKIDDRDPNIEQTTGPIAVELIDPRVTRRALKKKKSNGKRKNNSNR